jgi:hypothetical protein
VDVELDHPLLGLRFASLRDRDVGDVDSVVGGDEARAEPGQQAGEPGDDAR